jgi:hypothetical protein
MEESFLAEETLLKGNQEKSQERQRNPDKDKEKATVSSRKEEDYNVRFKQCFRNRKDLWNLTPSGIKE